MSSVLRLKRTNHRPRIPQIPLLAWRPKPMVVASLQATSKAQEAQEQEQDQQQHGGAGSFEGLPWGLWQARTTLLAGLCKVI